MSSSDGDNENKSDPKIPDIREKPKPKVADARDDGTPLTKSDPPPKKS